MADLAREVTPGLPHSLEESYIPVEYEVPWDNHLITSKRHADALLARITASGHVAIDTETNGLSWSLGDRAFMHIYAPDLETSYACWNMILNGYIMEKIEAMRAKMIFHNFKFDAEMMFSAGSWQPHDYDSMDIEDTLVGYRLFFAGQDAGLKKASGRYLEAGVDIDGPEKAVKAWFEADYKERMAEKKKVKGKWIVKKEVRYDWVPFDLMFPYATQDAAMTLRSYLGLHNEGSQRTKLAALWRREVDLLQILVSAERYGWHLNKTLLDERISNAQSNLEQYLEEFKDFAPDVNPLSSKQLAEYIYDVLGEPVKHLTKKGGRSTDESALTDMDNQSIGNVLVNIRHWKKLLDKCLELREYTMEDNSVHSDLKLQGARTGRFSSAGPALQNIANYKPQAPWTWVRDLFIPRDFTSWLLFDYSQIEMRLAAHYSKDPTMMEAYLNGIDLHTKTASQMFGVPMDAVTPQQRSFGKLINFSLLYGAGVRRIKDSLRFGSAQNDPVELHEARRALLKFIPYADDSMIADPYTALAKCLLKAYWAAFPAMKEFTTQVKGVAYSRGYIVTAMGRETPVGKEATHKATNYLIQGSAADLMKAAMVRTWRLAIDYCKENGLTPWEDVFLFMTIHDEIIFALSNKVERDSFTKHIRPGAEDWPQFRVPIEVDFAVVEEGSSWATKKKYKVAA